MKIAADGESAGIFGVGGYLYRGCTVLGPPAGLGRVISIVLEPASCRVEFFFSYDILWIFV